MTTPSPSPSEGHGEATATAVAGNREQYIADRLVIRQVDAIWPFGWKIWSVSCLRCSTVGNRYGVLVRTQADAIAWADRHLWNAHRPEHVAWLTSRIASGKPGPRYATGGYVAGGPTVVGIDYGQLQAMCLARSSLDRPIRGDEGQPR